MTDIYLASAHCRGKRVEIWLTRTEGQDATLRDSLIPLYQKYKAQGCLVVVFRFGGQDLTDATSALLQSKSDGPG